MNHLLHPAPRNRRHAPRAALTLTPVYRRLIIVNTLLSGAWLILNLVAAH